MRQPLRSLFDNFVDSLIGNFAVTPARDANGAILELTYIEDVERVDGRYIRTYLLMTEKEIELKANAVNYYLTDRNTVERVELDRIILNVESTQIIPISNDNIVSLMIDKDKLIRKASEEWYIARNQKSNRVKSRFIS